MSVDADNLAAALDDIRKRYEVWGDANDVPRLLAAVGAVLKAHEPTMIYDSGDDCGHPKPDESDEEAFDRWLDDHPCGSTPSDDAVRICHLSPRELACRACSELVYETWGDDDRWVSAGECIVLPVISRELLAEEGGTR